MARHSRWSNLKPKVLQLFEEGKKPFEVSNILKDIPIGTIYGWYKEFRSNSEQFRSNSEVIPKPLSDGNLSDTPRGVVSADILEKSEDLSDFDLARQTFRDLSRSADTEGNKIQAAYGLLKVTEIEIANQHRKSISREDFLQVTQEMWSIVKRFVEDPETLQKIKEGWRAIRPPQ